MIYTNRNRIMKLIEEIYYKKNKKEKLRFNR